MSELAKRFAEIMRRCSDQDGILTVRFEQLAELLEMEVFSAPPGERAPGLARAEFRLRAGVEFYEQDRAAIVAEIDRLRLECARARPLVVSAPREGSA